MSDTTDTATFATGLREMASDPRDYVIEDYWDACNQAADALDRLAAENAELRKDIATHAHVLLEWLGENVTDDPAYLSAVDWARGVNKMAEGKG